MRFNILGNSVTGYKNLVRGSKSQDYIDYKEDKYIKFHCIPLHCLYSYFLLENFKNYNRLNKIFIKKRHSIIIFSCVLRYFSFRFSM